MLYPVAIWAIVDMDERDFMMRLYDVHYRVMCAQAYRVLQDRQHVDDVVSEACIALIEKVEILTRMERPVLRAYVVSTVRNTALNYGKRLSRQRKWTLDNPDLVFTTHKDDGTEIDSSLLLSEEVECVKGAILQLPEAEQRVMQMKFYENMSNDEIGRHLGIKSESVRKYLLRARRHIFEIVGKTK